MATSFKTHHITGKKISQKDSEIGGMIRTLAEHDCKSYLEIGAREGNTFYDVMTSLPHGSKGVAVDLPAGTWGKSGTDKSLVYVCEKLRELGYDITMILGDSTSQEIIDAVASHGKFDAMLIDGDHRLDGVTKDWENYSPLANKIVAFHDIDGHGVAQKNDPSLLVEVPILWESLKKQFPSDFIEFIDRKDQPTRPMGIGLIIL